MGTQQVSAPPCAPPGPAGVSGPTSGVIHVNVRHTAGFTVIGNHLSQHRGLSLVAVGLAVHIQSLPAGAKIGIKRLAERFPESETRIAAALRELEAAGYLHRSRLRLADGRVVTRTVSYNQPGAEAPAVAVPQQRQRQRTARPVAAAPASPPAPAPAPTPPPHPPSAPLPVHGPAPTARTAPPPPLPRPSTAAPELHRAAAALLADLRRHAPELALAERDVEALAPGVAAWLEREARPEDVRRALTADLPVPLKHPAKLLRHRITALLPPPLPGAHELTPVRRAGIVIPLQNCDHCDRAFRSRHPGPCRDCRADAHLAA
ncbi:helix-turn-helix domain-containing protein [Streptomyces sp. NBC_01012]|uniref:helix-turn-helix domain-containing protein n=1 Tax=Streptomyces sp. NBC_01012 TaxID=2903717 RepID=UPI003866D1DB|nr:helix-turn-helix domain-containing protein [Streptomyces sp. NBC_01012]